MRRVSASCLTCITAGLIACGEGNRLPGSTVSDDGIRNATSGSASTTGDSSSSTSGDAPVEEIPTVPGISNCAFEPINPNATQPARNLLCYVYEIYGKSVLSGQQETSWANNPADDVDWIYQQTGKYPAILGGDYLYPLGTTSRAKAWWNAGGIVMLRYHMGAPPLSDTYEYAKLSVDIDVVLTAGTPENISFVSKLDYAARELRILQNANVPVLWAPLHEAQSNGWFWWSMGTGEQYVALWKYMYDYLTNTKGLNNLIWLMPFSGTPNASFYPGKEYVDLAGPDTYSKSQPFASIYGATTRIVGATIPIPLHETGVVPNPDAMFPTAAPWVLFNTWAGYEKRLDFNPTGSIQTAYASAYTITRDEVPDLK